MNPRTCIACKHFSVEGGYYMSSLTWREGSVNCHKEHFSEHADNTVALAMSKAILCEDYELSELAISKGWTK